MRFDAYPERQFVTESININSLADHHIWSTIKTLPATLPEPSSKVQGSRPQPQAQSTFVLEPRPLEASLAAVGGLLKPFLSQIWMSVRGGGG